MKEDFAGNILINTFFIIDFRKITVGMARRTTN